jgi:UDP-N-acetylglucosamine diphosphorylase/glucosamine-1-phosphate N-acetyltransferase
VSIGKVCKVGGEVEDMIMMDYSNKQHAGFIGHSYLGSWVNLGADTNCSDLKNNYSQVKIKLSSGEVDTGMQFLGVLVGDHTKTAINTMFNTGTVAGFSSNIFGAGFPDKYIPSFSWGGSDAGFIEYDPEKSIKTAKIVTARRNVPFTASDEKLFKNIFEMTRKERMNKEFVK